MNVPLYIESAVAISPQESFEPARFLTEPRHSDRGWLTLIDAPYWDYINPVAIRRMSRILKVSISAAMEAVQSSSVVTPDAIITGTGRGVVTDMEQFVKDMERLKEATLNPTLFIQSTYNSANGWIAMQTKCQGYNQTYVHRGISFELALQDAMMLVAEQEADCVLCGAFDEMTGEHYHIYGKVGTWRNPAPHSLRLYESEASGTIGGEGAAFFMLCRERRAASAGISGMDILYYPDGSDVKVACDDILSAAGIAWGDVDVLVSGFNGDQLHYPLYEAVHEAAAIGGGYVHYKQLVGEYDSSTSFGLWLADWLIKHNSIPDTLQLKGSQRRPLRNVLVVNSYELQTVGIILVQAVPPLTDK